MVYFFVDKNGAEGCANERPYRNFGEWVGWDNTDGYSCNIVSLPKGTIEKTIGRVLTWENEPYYYTGSEEYDKLNNPTYYES